MARRRFRYNRELDKMVEVPLDGDFEPSISVHGEIEPFISPRDGTLIRSRAHLRDYMAKNDLVHYDEAKTQQAEGDRYAASRDRQQMREMLWERVNKTFSMGNKPRR